MRDRWHSCNSSKRLK